jgi:hypothetical protein
MCFLDRRSFLDAACDVQRKCSRERVKGLAQMCAPSRIEGYGMRHGGQPSVTHHVSDFLEALCHLPETDSKRVEHSGGNRESQPTVVGTRERPRDRTNGSGNLSLERVHDRKGTIEVRAEAIRLTTVGQSKPKFPRMVLSRSEKRPSEVFPVWRCREREVKASHFLRAETIAVKI